MENVNNFYIGRFDTQEEYITYNVIDEHELNVTKHRMTNLYVRLNDKGCVGKCHFTYSTTMRKEVGGWERN